MKLHHCTRLILACATVCIAPQLATAEPNPPKRPSAVANQVVVKLRPSSSNPATLQRLSRQIGRVFVRSPKSHSFRFILKPGVSTSSAVTLLKKDRAVAYAGPVTPQPRIRLPQLFSVRNITRTINALEARAEARKEREDRERYGKKVANKKQERAHKPKGMFVFGRLPKAVKVGTGLPVGPEEDEKAGTDYIRAYRYWYSQRAYPYDSIPRDAYFKAVAQRDQMKPAPLGGRAGSGKSIQGIGGGWEFTGPRNLDVPYRTYWGPRPVSGRINAVAYDKSRPGTYYAGAAGGGLWITNDSGANWTPLGDDWTSLQVSSIAIDPVNSLNVYVGTGDYDGFGVWSFGLRKSTDGGMTWTTLGANEFAGSAVNSIVIDPENTNRITVGTGRSFNWGNSYVWHSEDGGQTWIQALPVASNWKIAMGPRSTKGQRFMFAVSDTQQLWRSADRGKTWVPAVSPVTDDGEAHICMSSHDFGTIYLISAADEQAYKSIDLGQTWQNISGTLDDWSQSFYDMYIAAAPGFDFWGQQEDIVYAGLIDFWQGTSELTDYLSAGLTTTNGALTHNDQHGFASNPLDFTEALLGNDGGAYRYKYDAINNIRTFDSLNTNLGVTQFYKAAWHPTNPDIMLGGTQDNATPVSTGDLNNWGNVAGGDGGYAAINPDSPERQFATIYGATVIRTVDGWQTQQNISPNIGSDNAPFVTCISHDPGDPRYLYMGTNYLWVWDDVANTWTPRLGDTELAGDNGVISCIEGFKGDHDRIYTGSTDGHVWMTTERRTFTRLNPGGSALPSRAVTSIDVNPNDKDDILVGLSGFGTAHLWRCSDTRAVTPLFVDVSGTAPDRLPDAPINCIARDPYDPESTWYVGTDIGVFMTMDAGQTWTNATQPLGLPNVQVNDIQAVPGTGYLNVATYGRGMWRILLKKDQVFLDSLTLDPTSVCDGGPSTGTITLKFPAPGTGANVEITSSDPSLVSVPASVPIPAGQRTATFAITTQPVTATTKVTITASVPSTPSSVSAELTLEPFTVSGISITPNPVIVPNLATGTVTVSCESTKVGTVTLSSSDTTVATVPASVSVNPGSTTATFTATPKATGVGKSTIITATMNGGSVSVELFVEGILDAVTFNPNPVLAGQNSTGRVTLRTPAPVGGVVVNLSSSDTNLATVPATLTIPFGATTRTFATTTKPVSTDTSVRITATSNGSTRSGDLGLIAEIIPTLTVNPTSVRGGNNATGTVRLNVAAPAGGIVVNLSSSIPAIAQTPATVTIPANQTQRNFTITTSGVGIATDVTITAAYLSKSSAATLTVLPNSYVFSQRFKPNPACANTFVIGTVSLTGPAPAGGAVVTLTSSDPSVATVPATVTVPAGQLSKTYSIAAGDVPVELSTTITATFAGVSHQDVLTVKPSVLTFISIQPEFIKSGGIVTLTVNLSCPAPAGGAVITLTSSDPAALQPPDTAIVPAGKTAATFQLKSKPVLDPTPVSVTATYHGTTLGGTVTVVP